ncbi:MAG: BatD family protein, partial [Proteobacteria bacterium]|nr:BatD family protein [Pseudomonadota bacterium]
GQRLGSGIPNGWLNNPNALLNSPLNGFGSPVRATAPVTRLDARAAPAGAGKPWLPARGVQLQLTGLPADGKLDAGAPLTVTLSISADGQPAGALPEPELPPIAGARVYPDQTRDSTDDSGQWLQGTRTRSFAIVPDRNGALTLPAITLDWWNVTRDSAEQARVPAHTLAVSGVVASPSAPVPPAVAAPVGSSATRVAPAASAATVRGGAVAAPSLWRNVALASLLLWVLAIVAAAWWFLRGRKARDRALSAAPAAAHAAPVSAPVDARVLHKRALDATRGGDAAACEHALLAWARAERPAITQAGSLRAALSDPAQQDALDGLQRARWRGGDATAACAAVARVFAGGFVWRMEREPAGADDPALPPLYPS